MAVIDVDNEDDVELVDTLSKRLAKLEDRLTTLEDIHAHLGELIEGQVEDIKELEELLDHLVGLNEG